MIEKPKELPGYRWVVLAVFMLINVLMQVLWICYAPIAGQAADYFNVSKANIDLLASLFLIIYIPVAIPAAWAIDHLGIRRAVGFGAAMMGVFGLVRAIFPASYPIAIVTSIGIAIGQPFLMGAMTKIAALWFPQRQRASITGLMFLALFVGVAIGEAVTPGLVDAWGISGMELCYGWLAFASAALFISLVRDRPAGSLVSSTEPKTLILDGIKHMLKDRDVYILMLLILLGSTIINGIFTLIDGFGSEKHFTVAQGVLLVTLILAGGIVGSIVLPGLSDSLRRRKPILVASAFAGGCLTIALTTVTNFNLALLIGALVGFFLTGVVPVAYQYGAEITHPTPEGTSNGLLGLVLQCAGFLILAMDALKSWFHESYLPSLMVGGILIVICSVFLLTVRESLAVQRVIVPSSPGRPLPGDNESLRIHTPEDQLD